MSAQALTLRQAVQTALNNYGTIRAKANYVKASQANVKEVKTEYLPDINFAASRYMVRPIPTMGQRRHIRSRR